MTLRYDPLHVFKNSTTPAGLYARQKWLAERQTPQWQHEFKSTVALLTKDQETNGSWRASTTLTVKQLFGLHLTVRQPTPQINKALDWLLEKARRQLNFAEGRSKKSTASPIPEQLPFVAGRRDGFTLGATLFLASIFGRQNHSQILALFQRLDEDAHQKQLYWKDLTCLNNIFRAFVVHPLYANQLAVRTAVRQLRTLQTAKGDWGPQLPFYQIVNALAHLEMPEADQQLEPAFQCLVQSQKPDGTWSTDQPEWHTFLVVHALKNKNRF